MASNHTSFFIERTDYSLRLARVSHGGDSDVVEEVYEAVPGSAEEAKAFIQSIADDNFGGYLRAHCAIYPSRRVLRTCSLQEDAENGRAITLQEVITNQFRINPNDYVLGTLQADNGLTHDPATRTQKGLFVCGAPREELQQAQEYLVAAGVYPLRMELGSVATAGLLQTAARVQNMQDPVLMLEIGDETSHVMILNSERLESARPLPLGLNSMIAGVRQELGLKDESAARRLFFSDSFDFREMGPRLIDRLLRELQSMIGFYEVQTGQSITHMMCSLLPAKLSWLNQTFASCLGMARFEIDLPAVLAESNVAVAQSDPPIQLHPPFGLLGLMVNQEVEV